jgi:hypothetical protein
MILFYLNLLPRLSSLTIHLEEDSQDNVKDVYRIMLCLPSLKYSKLSASYYDESNLFIPLALNQPFSTIEYLVILVGCSIKDLTSILYHTPHLRHLYCHRLLAMDEIGGKEVSLTLPNLTHVHFEECLVKFDAFKVFMKKICSKLQRLYLMTYSNMNYLDANRWEQLIKKHMPHLCKFYLSNHVFLEYSNDIIPDHKLITQFITPFWIERQWYFELEKYMDGLIYSINSYK